MATSENGWAVLKPGNSLIRTWNIPTAGGTVRLATHTGSVGFLLAYWVSLFAQFIQPVIGRVLDDWGYAYREIRASTGWSNHASATAIDLNAMQHPLGKVGTFLKAALLRTLLATRLRGLIKWGGDYQSRKDEMHFEIKPGVTLGQCEALARRLMKTRRGRMLLDANPGQEKVINS